MRKFLAGLISALLLLAAPLVPALGISDVGRPELTRLWRNTDEGDRFTCTATYIFPYANDYVSWLVSAGHCTIAELAARNQSDTIRSGINWRGVVNTHGEYGTNTIDIAVATTPDMRKGDHKRIWLADKAPDGGVVYIHGFPAGIEEVDLGYVVPEAYNEKISIMIQVAGPDGYPELQRKNLKELLPGLRAMVVKHDRIVGGSSGSPVLGPDDRLVGILWGVIGNEPRLAVQGLPQQFSDYDIVLFTPVERVHDLFKALGVEK